MIPVMSAALLVSVRFEESAYKAQGPGVGGARASVRVLLSLIPLTMLRWSFLVSDLSCCCLSSSMSLFSLFISAVKVGDVGRGRLLRNWCRCFSFEVGL